MMMRRLCLNRNGATIIHQRSLSSIVKGKKRGRPQQEQQTVSSNEDDSALEVLRRESRRRKERTDSVSDAMLEDRRNHFNRMMAVSGEPPKDIMQKIKALRLGQKQKAKDSLKYRQSSKDPSSGVGATGFATYLAASGAGKDWPTFKHMLPEVAFAGHSNCGKSSLINAVSGMAPKRGVARVSDRAGWTDAIFFYQLGKKPPILTMADLPGYGHAVATLQQKRKWKEMIHEYLTNRPVLSMCCVLVDSIRGLCREDKDLLRFLRSRQIPTKVILTKADLLDEDELARSHAVVCEDLKGIMKRRPEREGRREEQGQQEEQQQQQQQQQPLTGKKRKNHEDKEDNDLRQQQQEELAMDGNVVISKDTGEVQQQQHMVENDKELDVNVDVVISKRGEGGRRQQPQQKQQEVKEDEEVSKKEEGEEGEKRQQQQEVVKEDEEELDLDVEVDVVMVSASTGAGVTSLWNELVRYTRKDVIYRGDIGLHQASIR